MDTPISNKTPAKFPSVIGFGEALVDVIVHNSGHSAVIPGGSVLNSIVSLARSGINTALITELGKDGPGSYISEFLQQEAVSTEFIQWLQNGKTALAFAKLDDRRNAAYSFYKQYPETRVFDHLPEMNSNQVFLFGSFYALQKELGFILNQLTDIAASSGALIFYDPNIRSHNIHFEEYTMPKVLNYCKKAHIVRGSDEDFINLFGTDKVTEIYQAIQPSACKLLVVTRAENSVSAFDGASEIVFDVPKISVVSTVGAGDAMNAGMIKFWIVNNYKINDAGFSSAFPHQVISGMIKSGLEYALSVCGSNENYISRSNH